jgi:hypothetical protein
MIYRHTNPLSEGNEEEEETSENEQQKRYKSFKFRLVNDPTLTHIDSNVIRANSKSFNFQWFVVIGELTSIGV